MFELVPFVIAGVAALLGALVGLLLGKAFGRFRGVVAAVVILVVMSSAMYRPLTDGVSLSLGFVTRPDLVLRDAAERLAGNPAIRRQLRLRICPRARSSSPSSGCAASNICRRKTSPLGLDIS